MAQKFVHTVKSFNANLTTIRPQNSAQTKTPLRTKNPHQAHPALEQKRLRNFDMTTRSSLFLLLLSTKCKWILQHIGGKHATIFKPVREREM
jgi:hypothetical protein